MKLLWPILLLGGHWPGKSLIMFSNDLYVQNSKITQTHSILFWFTPKGHWQDALHHLPVLSCPNVQNVWPILNHVAVNKISISLMGQSKDCVVWWLIRRKAKVRAPGQTSKQKYKKVFLRRFPLNGFLAKKNSETK